jgi:hypothetical protein
VGEVADHDLGTTPGATDLLGDGVELGLGTGGNHNVRTGFGEGQRHGGAEAAARPGDYRDLVVEPESVKNHVVPLLLSAETVTRDRCRGDRIPKRFWNRF